ncbi:hypothetical protein DFH07DRAFT_934257 [Mycena maculata]|uniref:Uncharacterized protein n=1 Tax=Mycena maculata TaxID=230809 RepID=A0AAD7HBK2_9AGAR|nr:hypothetical protein DFH07DRAFT_934257 [Mycena maculata]
MFTPAGIKSGPTWHKETRSFVQTIMTAISNSMPAMPHTMPAVSHTMPLSHPIQEPASATTMPTYRRTMSQNEISYFLPSRAYGLNDMSCRLIFRAPPTLITPIRIRIVWAIMRLRHTLMACRFEMEPGCYDDAQFVYTPPSTPREALAEAAACVRVYNDVTGPELMQDFLSGPRTLSADCLSALHVANHGRVAPGINEYHMLAMYHHGINDTLAVGGSLQITLELLGGPATPGGAPRSDVELARLLDDEWRRRWSVARDPADVIVPATEARILGLPRSKFCEAAWKVDHQLIQKRFIGGHVFPRIKTTVVQHRLFQVKFSVAQTTAILAKCKSHGVTLQNTMFALCNVAWIRLCAAHPEIPAPKALPMLMYTAISIRRYLAPRSPLSSDMSLALEYFNVVLPAFLPRKADPRKVFWARGRAVQRQMFAYAHSPLLLGRSLVTSAARGRRAKAFARLDDEKDGTLPRRASPSPRALASPSPPNPKPAPAPNAPPPAAALLGLSLAGNTDAIVRPAAYPALALVDIAGGARKAPGGMLFAQRTFLGRLNVTLHWDGGAFGRGVVEEFWGSVVRGVREFLLEEDGEAGEGRREEEELEPLRGGKVRGRARL